jgi:hypothetical protein
MSDLAAVRCLLRGLPLLFGAAPKTPLRVLAIVALDTVHVLRTSRPLSRKKLGELALLLDFQADTNAAWDRKARCRDEHLSTLQRLERAGLGRYLEDYLGRLRALEGGRPPIGGDRRNFDATRAYREAVARLSLATVTAVALDARCVEDAIGETRRDGDLDTLWRMAVQCQVIDDVVDYEDDLSAGLPSFLTSTSTLSEAAAWTAGAARIYGAGARGAFSLRVALGVVSAAARLAVRFVPSARLGQVEEVEIR